MTSADTVYRHKSYLHTRECIHGRYFIASPSIHTIADVLAVTKVSMIYTTFQIELLVKGYYLLKLFVVSSLYILRITCHHLRCFLPFPENQRNIFISPQKGVISPPRNACHSQTFQMKTNLQIFTSYRCHERIVRGIYHQP